MNKNELIDATAATAGCSKAEAARAVTALTQIITDILKKGESVSLPGFGTFEVRDRGARTILGGQEA